MVLLYAVLNIWQIVLHFGFRRNFAFPITWNITHRICNIHERSLNRHYSVLFFQHNREKQFHKKVNCQSICGRQKSVECVSPCHSKLAFTQPCNSSFTLTSYKKDETRVFRDWSRLSRPSRRYGFAFFSRLRATATGTMAFQFSQAAWLVDFVACELPKLFLIRDNCCREVYFW